MRIQLIFVYVIIFFSIISIKSCKSQLCIGKQVDTQNLLLPYEVTYHEYIITEYFSRYSTSHYGQTLLDNKDSFVVDEVSGDSFDHYLAQKFIIDNFHLFADSLLFQTVVDEASFLMNKGILPYTDLTQGKMSFKKLKENLLDYDNCYSKINEFQFKQTDLYNELYTFSNSNNSCFYAGDIFHFNELLIMIKNDESLDDLIHYVESVFSYNNNYSQQYYEIMDFALNTLKFCKYWSEKPYKNSAKTDFWWLPLAIEAGYCAGWDIGAIKAGRDPWGVVAASSVQYIVIQIIIALETNIASFSVSCG